MLVLCVVFCGGCSTLSKVDDIATRTQAYLSDVDAKVRGIQEWTESRIATAEADRARFESTLTGPWDADGDGRVSAGEINSMLKDVAVGSITSPEKRSLWTDGEFWTAVGVALAGGWLGLRGAKRGVGALHNAGRSALGETERVVR